MSPYVHAFLSVASDAAIPARNRTHDAPIRLRLGDTVPDAASKHSSIRIQIVKEQMTNDDTAERNSIAADLSGDQALFQPGDVYERPALSRFWQRSNPNVSVTAWQTRL